MLASYSSQGPSKFNRISDGPQNRVKTTAMDIDENVLPPSLGLTRCITSVGGQKLFPNVLISMYYLSLFAIYYCCENVKKMEGLTEKRLWYLFS